MGRAGQIRTVGYFDTISSFANTLANSSGANGPKPISDFIITSFVSELLRKFEEAKALVRRTEERVCFAELHRLRRVFLANLSTNEDQTRLHFAKPSESHKAEIDLARETKNASF